MSDELRKLAEAATPGPWQQSRFVDSPHYSHMGQLWKESRIAEEAMMLRGPGRIGSPECNPVASVPDPDTRAYIAAASPDVILALLDERDKLRAALTVERIAEALLPILVAKKVIFFDRPPEEGTDVQEVAAALRTALLGADEKEPHG